jgi:hypothetical protein
MLLAAALAAVWVVGHVQLLCLLGVVQGCKPLLT